MSKIISENLIPVYEALEMGIAGILTTEEVDDFLNEAFPVTEGASNSEDVANWRDKFLGLIEDVNKQAKSQASYSKVKEYDDCINVSKELIKLCGTIKGMIGRLNPDEQEIIVAWALKHTRSTLGSKQPKKFKDNYYFLSSEYAHMQAYCMKADKLSAKYEKAKKEKKNIKIAKSMIDLMKGMWDLYALINRMTIKKCSKEQQADILLKKSYKKESVEDWTMDMHKLYMDNFFENVNELLEEDEKTYIESVVDTCFTELQDFACVCEATEGTLSDNWVAATQDVFESVLSKDEKLFAKAFIEFAEMEHVLEEIDETVFVESSNSEIRAEYRGIQKELRKYVKDYKKSLKENRYSDAKVAARKLHDSMMDGIKKVDNIESDKTTSIQQKALMYALLEYASIILYFIIFLSSPAAASVVGAGMIYGGVIGLTFITTAEINKWKSRYVKLKEGIGKVGKDDDAVDTLKDEVISYCYDMAEYASKLETEVDKIKAKREKKDLKKGLKPMSESVHTIGLTEEEVVLVEGVVSALSNKAAQKRAEERAEEYDKAVQREVGVRLKKSENMTNITNSINAHKINIINAVRDGNESLAVKECTALKKDIIRLTNLLVTGNNKNEIAAYSAFYNMEVRTLQAEILYLHNYITHDKKEIARLNKTMAKLAKSRPMKKFNEKMRETRYGMASENFKEYEDNHKDLIEMCKVCSSSMDSIISSIKKSIGKATKESVGLSKFEKVKAHLYQECAAGNITLDDRERLIMEARELYPTDVVEESVVAEVNEETEEYGKEVTAEMLESVIMLAKEKVEAGTLTTEAAESLNQLTTELESVLNGEEDADDEDVMNESTIEDEKNKNIDKIIDQIEKNKVVIKEQLNKGQYSNAINSCTKVNNDLSKLITQLKSMKSSKLQKVVNGATFVAKFLFLGDRFQQLEKDVSSSIKKYIDVSLIVGTSSSLALDIEKIRTKIKTGAYKNEADFDKALNDIISLCEKYKKEIASIKNNIEKMQKNKGSLTKESTENQSKFEAVKKVLYEKCAEGEITAEQRENLIISARERYLG